MVSREAVASLIVLIFWFVCYLKTFCVQRRRRREGLLIPDKATHVGDSALVALRKHKYATLRELAAAVAAQYAVVAALFDSECLPDDAFACVASFWLGPRGYDAAPAPRPRLAMPSIELESSSSA